jgi:S1-C subfamily serine protease
LLSEEDEAKTDELAAPGSAVGRQRLLRLRTAVRKALPFVSGVLAALAAVLLYQLLTPDPQPLTLREVDAAVAEALAEATPAPAYSSLIYDVIRPALVLIEVHTPGAEEDAEEEDGLGTGVVVNTDGDILTSLHVVTNTTDIRLTFADGTQSGAQVIAAEPDSDIAVLRASQPPALLVPAVLGNPDAMRIGDEAFAVGHPFGLYGSMSTGVISGLNRTFRHPDSEQRLQGLMQIDAAVNPGNSGGPLLNRYGQVVGIVTGLVNPTDENFFVGIGFAVPIDVAGGAAGLPPY